MIVMIGILAQGCRKTAEKTIEKSTGGKVDVHYDEKNQTVTVKTPDGKIMTGAQSADKSGKVTITDGKGHVSVYEAGTDLTYKDVGIAFFKDAKVVSSARAQSAGYGSATQVVLETPAAFENVKKFYMQVQPRSAFSSDLDNPNGRTAIWTWKDKDFQYTISVARAAGEKNTVISLGKMQIK